MTQEENSRLIFYRKIKNQFKLEEYLNADYETRNSIARMRTSSHSIEIETGRHKKVPRNDRHCKICNSNTIETEEHFLFECETYALIRRKLDLVKPHDLYTFFDPRYIHRVGKYITQANKFRNSILTLKIFRKNHLWSCIRCTLLPILISSEL